MFCATVQFLTMFRVDKCSLPGSSKGSIQDLWQGLHVANLSSQGVRRARGGTGPPRFAMMMPLPDERNKTGAPRIEPRIKRWQCPIGTCCSSRVLRELGWFEFFPQVDLRHYSLYSGSKRSQKASRGVVCSAWTATPKSLGPAGQFKPRTRSVAPFPSDLREFQWHGFTAFDCRTTHSTGSQPAT